MIQQKVNRARLLLLKKKHFTFISSMLYKLNYQVAQVPTMAYDGSKNMIYLNEKWFLGLSDEEACSALAHEALHYALQHDLRQGNRDPKTYNEAADHVVNNILMDCGFTLPDNVPVDRRFQNKTVEYVYNWMMDEDNQDEDNDENSDSPFGNDIMPSPITPQLQSQRNRETLAANQTEEQMGGKGIGSESSAFESLFQKIKMETGLNWKTVLIEFLNEMTKGDKSWARLDRRMLSLGYYMPDQMEDNKIKRIAVAVDVSGSVSPSDIKQFLAECNQIKNTLNPEVMDIVSFDTEITGTWSFDEDTPIQDVNMRIGGGTSLRPVWKHFEKDENKPEFLIVMSDMYVGIPEEPDYTVIWGAVNRPDWKGDYGKTVYISTTEEEEEEW